MTNQISEIENKLFEITKSWNEYEDDMGENAALEVACSQNGTDSGWYYSNIFNHHENVNKRLAKLYGK